MRIRRLGPGDEDVVRRLATQAPPARADDLMVDERTLFLVAFDDDEPIGFVLAYELLRRHGDPSQLYVYEVEVAEGHRRCGVGSALMAEVERFARERGIRRAFLHSEPDNDAAAMLYRRAGGMPDGRLLWSFDHRRQQT